MISTIKRHLNRPLRWSEKYLKADMAYIARGNFWLLFSRAIAVGSGLLLTLAFANLLTPTEFGTYKYVLAIAGFVGAFSLTGLSTAAMKAVAQGKSHVIPSLFRTSVLWCIPASLVTLAVGTYYFSQGNMVLGYGLIFVALSNPFLSSFILWKSAFVGAAEFKAPAWQGLPRTVIPVAIVLVALLFTKNLVVIVGAYFLSQVIMGWLMYRFTLKTLKIQDRAEGVSDVIREGKQLSILSFVILIAAQIDQLLLWHFHGASALAVYALALAPVRELRGVSENFFSLMFRKLARKTRAELSASVPLRMFQMTVASGVCVLAYILAAPYLFAFLFPQYMSSVFASQLLALALLLQSKGIIEIALVTHGDMKLRSIAILSSQVAKILLFVLLIPSYGLMGAVIAVLVGEALSAIILLISYKRWM